MPQKLLREVGLMAVLLLAASVMLTSCIEEPNPPVLDRITSEVRFVHAVPDAQAVDIWVDGDKVAANVNYKVFSEYLEIKSGNRFIRVAPAGADTSNSYFRRLLSIRSLTKMTMVFGNIKDDMVHLTTQERFTYADEVSVLIDSCDVKLINLNLSGESYRLERKISETEAVRMIDPVELGSLSPYTRQLAEGGEFHIASGASGPRLITFPFELKKPGYRYTFIVVGTALNREVLTLQDEPK